MPRSGWKTTECLVNCRGSVPSAGRGKAGAHVFVHGRADDRGLAKPAIAGSRCVMSPTSRVPALHRCRYALASSMWFRMRDVFA